MGYITNKTRSKLKVVSYLTTITALSSTFFIVSSVFADTSGVDKFTLNLPVTCTIDSGSSSIHTQSVINNQYYPTLGGSPTNFTMYCNDNNGYIVYAIGASNNEEGNTNLIGDTLSGNSNIATGIYDATHTTSSSPSSWSMKLNTSESDLVLNSNYNDTFNVIPNTWTEVLRKNSGTVDSSVGSHITITYDTYINATQPAGTYTGRVKYVMFHPSSSIKPTTLAEAYKNAGKSKVEVTDPTTGETIGNYYRMQDMTSAICDAVNVYGEASQTELVDIRDGKLYWTTKLHTDKYNDNVGQCWMTQNLDLDLISDVEADNYVALTSENTDLSTNPSTYASTGIYVTGYTYDTDTQVATWIPSRNTTTTTQKWSNSNNEPYSYDAGLVYPDSNVSKDKAGTHGLAGNYYNWTATVASNNSTKLSTGKATNSVCPKGWRLPNTRAEEGGYEYSKLFYAYDIAKDPYNTTGYATGGFNKTISAPLYFVRAGRLNNGDGSGWYESSVANLSSNALFFRFSNSSIEFAHSSPDGGGYRGYGFSIRCLAR